VWPKAVITAVGSCAGFVRAPNSSFSYGYILMKDSYDWHSAHGSICQIAHPNARMATIRDKAKMLHGLSMMNQSQIQHAWIAFRHSVMITENWFWADGGLAMSHSQDIFNGGQVNHTICHLNGWY
jgi:hypothetical protein